MTRADELPIAGTSLQLEYARPTEGLAGRDWRWGVFLVALLPAAVSPFVEFASSTSPLETLTEYIRSVRQGNWDEPGFFLLGAPFFTALPLWLWHARRLLWPSGTTLGECVAAYCIAVSSLAVTVFVVFAVWREDNGEREVLLAAVGVTAAGAVALARTWWRPPGDVCVAPMIALMTAYASNGLMLLLAFKGSDHPGYFLTAGGIVVMAIEATLLLRRPRQVLTPG